MCWYCGSPVLDEEPIGRSLRCGSCGKDLRSCRNCRHYAPGARMDCREPDAQVPTDRDRANFCDWFSLDKKYRLDSAGQSVQQNKAKAAKDAFDALFS